MYFEEMKLEEKGSRVKVPVVLGTVDGTLAEPLNSSFLISTKYAVDTNLRKNLMGKIKRKKVLKKEEIEELKRFFERHGLSKEHQFIKQFELARYKLDQKFKKQYKKTLKKVKKVEKK